jgi:hypothetical protein
LAPVRRSTARPRLVRLDSAQQCFDACGEALIAIAVPGVKTARGQGREAVDGQGAEERVQLFHGRGVVQALLGGRGGIGEGEADGVVVDDSEGQGGLAVGQPGREQRRKECLGQVQRRRAERVAGLEQGRGPGMAFQDRPQTVPQGSDLRRPRRDGVGAAVDLALGTTPRRAARARMLRACALSAAMIARASATTRSRLSARRLPGPPSSGLNHNADVPASDGRCPAMPASLLAALTVNNVHCSVNILARK